MTVVGVVQSSPSDTVAERSLVSNGRSGANVIALPTCCTGSKVLMIGIGNSKLAIVAVRCVVADGRPFAA